MFNILKFIQIPLSVSANFCAKIEVFHVKQLHELNIREHVHPSILLLSLVQQATQALFHRVACLPKEVQNRYYKQPSENVAT